MAEKIEISRLLNRRGLSKDLPQPLAGGELGFCTDSGQLFIGSTEAIDDEIILGSEIVRPAPADAINVANKFKDRTMLCDVITTITGASDAEIIQKIQDAITAADIYNGYTITTRPGYVGTPDVLDAVRIERVVDGNDVQNTRFRAYVGIYEVDISQTVPAETEAQALANIQGRLYAAVLVGTSTEVFEQRDGGTTNVVPASGSYRTSPASEIGIYNDGLFKFGVGPVALVNSEYSAISWTINNTYNVSRDKFALVTVRTNIQIITETTFEEFLDNSTRPTFFVSEDVFEESGWSYLTSTLELNSGNYRSYKMDYSYFVESSTGGELDSGIGSITMTVAIAGGTPTMNYEEDRTDNNILSGNFDIVPEISVAENRVKFRYQNNKSTDLNNEILKLKIYSIQWANF